LLGCHRSVAAHKGLNVLEPVTNLIELGGPVVVTLLILSVMGASVVAYKLIELRAYSSQFFADMAATLADRTKISALSNPVEELLSWAQNEKNAGRPRDEISGEAERRGNRFLNRCSRYLRLVELIAYLSPLLGLLGTVLGMIDAFRGLEVDVNQADAGVLAGGIWEALLTTAVGLGIAIPMTAAHALMEGRVRRIGEDLQDILEQAIGS